jgi:hypothetical protein
MLQKIILSISVLFISFSSYAMFIIEPSAGYRQETVKLTDLLQNQIQIKFNSPIFGLKLGFTNSTGISFDLAGSRSSGKAELIPSVATPPDYSHTIGSAQIGVNAMGLLKIYLGYVVFDELELQSNSSFQGFKFTGQGFQAGLMTFPLQRLGIGVQYNVHQFKEISGTNFTLGPDIKNYYDKVDVQDVSATLSFLF